MTERNVEGCSSPKRYVQGCAELIIYDPKREKSCVEELYRKSNRL